MSPDLCSTGNRISLRRQPLLWMTQIGPATNGMFVGWWSSSITILLLAASLDAAIQTDSTAFVMEVVCTTEDTVTVMWRVSVWSCVLHTRYNDNTCYLTSLWCYVQGLIPSFCLFVDTRASRCSETYRLSQHSDINKWEITTVQQDLIKSGPKSLMPLLACSALRDIEQLAGIHLAIRNMRIMSDLHCSTSLAQWLTQSRQRIQDSSTA